MKHTQGQYRIIKKSPFEGFITKDLTSERSQRAEMPFISPRLLLTPLPHQGDRDQVHVRDHARDRGRVHARAHVRACVRGYAHVHGRHVHVRARTLLPSPPAAAVPPTTAGR